MKNHFHMMIKPLGKEDLSKIMQWILSIFAVIYNKLNGYKGHVFYDRFRSYIIENIKEFINILLLLSSNKIIDKMTGFYNFNIIGFSPHISNDITA